MASIKVLDYSVIVMQATDEALKKAAKMIGGVAESHAKEMCPVDTGLLRNSIAYAVGGKEASVGNYASDDGTAHGKYTGTAPKDVEHEVTVYVGTNVQYGAYQELGAPSINLPAKPYLRPAIEDHRDEIGQIIEKCLKELK